MVSESQGSAEINLTNHFLIAMPNMVDAHFAGSVVYLAEHNAKGALGLVLNRPTDMDLGTLFERIDLPLDSASLIRQPVFFGGPVQTDRGFVLHRPVGSWTSTLPIAASIGLTSSRDILEAVGQGQGPAELLVTLGYAGWGPGQLESEISQNAWLTVVADPTVIFNVPIEERFSRAMALLGIDPLMLSGTAGHA